MTIHFNGVRVVAASGGGGGGVSWPGDGTKILAGDGSQVVVGDGLELSAGTLSAGRPRPAIDANHIHVYNCNDLTGGLSLVDSGIGTKNATLLGTENTNFTLDTYRGGGSVPFVRFLSDGSTSSGARTDSTCSISGGKITLECVVTLFSPPAASRGIVSLDAGSNDLLYINVTSGGGWYAGVKIGGGALQEIVGGAVRYGVPAHLMAVYDSTSSPALRLYVDGLLVASGAAGTLATMTRVTIGNFAALGAFSSQCYVRDVRVSNIARSASYALSSANASLGL